MQYLISDLLNFAYTRESIKIRIIVPSQENNNTLINLRRRVNEIMPRMHNCEREFRYALPIMYFAHQVYRKGFMGSLRSRNCFLVHKGIEISILAIVILNFALITLAMDLANMLKSFMQLREIQHKPVHGT